MKIGIIIAMEKELQQLKSLLTDASTEVHNGKNFYLGRMGRHEIVMQQCGIGKVNAAVGCVEMITHYHPEVIISSGCAGGGSTQLNIQDVVVSGSLTYHDVYCGTAIGSSEYGQVQGLPARYESPRELVDIALSLNEAPVTDVTSSRIHEGLIVTGDWFVDSKEKMREIMGHFPDAMAVDMESCAIAQTCYLYQVKFISFRVISDIPLKDDHAAQYHDFWSHVAEESFTVTRSFIEKL